MKNIYKPNILVTNQGSTCRCSKSKPLNYMADILNASISNTWYSCKKDQQFLTQREVICLICILVVPISHTSFSKVWIADELFLLQWKQQNQRYAQLKFKICYHHEILEIKMNIYAPHHLQRITWWLVCSSKLNADLYVLMDGKGHCKCICSYSIDNVL